MLPFLLLQQIFLLIPSLFQQILNFDHQSNSSALWNEFNLKEFKAMYHTLKKEKFWRWNQDVGIMCLLTYVVPRASSHKKFNSLSFFDPFNWWYPSPPQSKQLEGISFNGHLELETHLLRACNHEFFPLVELNGDLNSKNADSYCTIQ